MSTAHPWNSDLVTRLARDRDHLSHALLFAGQKGLGKNALAEWLAQLLLCTRPEGARPCGRCQNCTLFHSASHPDLHVVQPESVYRNSSGRLAQYAVRYPPENKSKDSKDSQVIRIDQIRALIEASQTRPQIAARKVLILSPADTLNVNAANSLLKLLEEPPADSTLLLVADRPARLTATIRSRCNRVDFRIPDTQTALAWLDTQGLPDTDGRLLLALSGGAPLAAKALSESGFLAQRGALQADLEALAGGQGDPLACAARWKTLGADSCLGWLQGWLADVAALVLRAEPQHLRNPELISRLQPLEKRLDLKQLFRFAETVARNRQLLGGSLDELLILEDTLIHWTDLQAN